MQEDSPTLAQLGRTLARHHHARLSIPSRCTVEPGPDAFTAPRAFSLPAPKKAASLSAAGQLLFIPAPGAVNHSCPSLR